MVQQDLTGRGNRIAGFGMVSVLALSIAFNVTLKILIWKADRNLPKSLKEKNQNIEKKCVSKMALYWAAIALVGILIFVLINFASGDSQLFKVGLQS